MTQTGDYVIANASGSSVRGDINETFENVNTSNAGGSAPSYKQQGTIWLDTGNNEFKYYTGSAWHPFLDTGGDIIAESGTNRVTLESSGAIEILATNGTPLIDFKRSGVDYDCRIAQTNDTNYDLFFNTGGDGSTKQALKLYSTGALEVGDAAVVGSRAGGSGGYASGVINCRGIAVRNGYNGDNNDGNFYNWDWTGSALQVHVGSSGSDTNLGTVTTSSDYRVKKNITTQTASGIEKVKQLRPVNYEYADNTDFSFRGDGVEREGFIAHEVAEVIPSGCEGAKDAANQIQSLKVDAIVSVLTKALQEAVAKIETLETKVAALEAK
tara:strand:- start:592 stop:1569 length:978 start_codon:yes stop_codon:yes gene_type:complete